MNHAGSLRTWTSPVRGAALVAAAGFGAYAGTLGDDFVYDDLSQVLHNPWIWQPRYLFNLLTKAVWSFQNSEPSNYYRPVQTLLYFLDAQIFGRHPFGFHLTNVLVHCFASAVAFILLRRFVGARRATLAALLFALHPAHVESVAWIAGSTDVDCALLVLTCLLSWSFARESSGRRRIALMVSSGLLFLLALLAKETAVVTPLLAFALPRCSLGPSAPSRRIGDWRSEAMRGVASFGAPLIVYVPVRLQALGGLHPLVRHAELSTTQIVASGLALVPRYLLVAIFPWKPMPEHVFVPVSGLFDPSAVLGALLLAGALAAAVVLARSAPAATFGFGLLVLPLLPVLQIQYVGPSAQADRYLYLPSLGASLLFAEAVAWLRGRVATPAGRGLLAGTCVLLAVTAAVRTMSAARMWRNDETLARAGIELEPRSVFMRINLAHVLDEEGRTNEAYEVAKQAAEIDPTNRQAAAAAAGLRIRIETRKPEDEIAMYRRALEDTPGQAFLWTDLSMTYIRSGRYEEAIQAAQRALTSDPYNVSALINLGTAMGRLGDFAGQEREALRLLEIDSDYAPGWLNLGAARLGLGNLDRSKEALLRAMDLDPRLARAHLYLSWIASRRADPQEALMQAKLASELDATDAEIWTHLGVVLAQSGDRDGARSAWERALTIAPGSQSALQNLERLKGAAGQANSSPGDPARE